MNMEFVYVAKSKLRNVYKIGYTRNPRQRIQDLRTSSPGADLVKIYGGSKFDEKYLHDLFNVLRVNGEWFRLEPENIKEIDYYFLNNGSDQLFLIQKLVIEIINAPVNHIRKRIIEKRDKARYNKDTVDLTDFEKIEIENLPISLKTAKIIKNVWQSNRDYTYREIAEHSGFSVRVVKYVMPVFKDQSSPVHKLG